MLLALQGFTVILIAVMGLLMGAIINPRKPFVTGICAAVASLAVTLPVMMLVTRHHERRGAELMAAEIGDPAYARIADLKGRSCAVDTLVAKAMRDGRITGAEYRPIMGLAADERLKGAKTAVAGIATNSSCKTETGRT